jgi:regulator of extracellular matrix RemA (YlzA/DUF370 family)
MKNGITTFGFVLILAAGAAIAAVDSPNASTVKRLDDTTISAQEIDATVTRLMSAARSQAQESRFSTLGTRSIGKLTVSATKRETCP